LCQDFEIYPDIWALKEWSNWVTPVSLPIRFDTIFFLTAFQQMPNTNIEEKEIHNFQVSENY